MFPFDPFTVWGLLLALGLLALAFVLRRRAARHKHEGRPRGGGQGGANDGSGYLAYGDAPADIARPSGIGKASRSDSYDDGGGGSDGGGGGGGGGD